MDRHFLFHLLFLCSVFQDAVETRLTPHTSKPTLICILTLILSQLKQAEMPKLPSIMWEWTFEKKMSKKEMLFTSSPFKGRIRAEVFTCTAEVEQSGFPFSVYLLDFFQRMFLVRFNHHVISVQQDLSCWAVSIVCPNVGAKRELHAASAAVLRLWSYKPSQWCRMVLSGGSPGGSSLKVQIRIPF